MKRKTSAVVIGGLCCLLAIGGCSKDTQVQQDSTQKSTTAVQQTQQEGYIYGTMNIPYNEFYAAEGVGYEVDAVSSATTSKWFNENLVAGTYNQPAENGGGKILGVKYYVAVTEEDLNKLSQSNYEFERVQETPKAYKIVSFENNKASFSEVQSAKQPVPNAAVTLTTQTNYGDYQLNVTGINNQSGTSNIGRIYGILVKADGKYYAMRHLENIWRDSIAWSVGFNTSNHGNTLNYEEYKDMAGKKITEILYITDTGYYTIDTDLYVPIKFEHTLTVKEAAVKDGKTSLEITGLPEKYEAQYNIEGLEATVENGTITFSNAYAGKYKLTVSDKKGVYSDISAEFILTTDVIPAEFDKQTNTLKAAENCSDKDLENYISNIASVSVNQTSYKASGKGAVAIISKDGKIDLAVEISEKNGDTTVKKALFGTNGTYEIIISATGYTQNLKFNLEVSGK